MAKSRNERGEGGFKVLLSVAVVFYGIFVGAKLLPALSDDKAIKAKTQEVLKFAGTNRWKETDMQFQIAEHAKALKIPIKEEDIKVVEDGNDYRATFTYDRVVKLIFYTYRKHIKIDEKYVKY